MSDEIYETHECIGCYLWENNISGICSYMPVDKGKVICPCVTCLVKAMCSEDNGCEEYTNAYNPEHVGYEE